MIDWLLTLHPIMIDTYSSRSSDLAPQNSLYHCDSNPGHSPNSKHFYACPCCTNSSFSRVWAPCPLLWSLDCRGTSRVTCPPLWSLGCRRASRASCPPLWSLGHGRASPYHDLPTSLRNLTLQRVSQTWNTLWTITWTTKWGQIHHRIHASRLQRLLFSTRNKKSVEHCTSIG